MNALKFFSLTSLLSFTLVACNQGPVGLRFGYNEDKPSEGTREDSNRVATISFAKVSAEAFQSCAACHQGGAKPDLFSYNDYRLHKEDILEQVVVTRKMPRKTKLSESQIELVKNWIEEGAPEFADNNIVAPTTTTTTLAPTPTTLPTIEEPPVTFENVQATFMGAKCLGCHSGFQDFATVKNKASEIYNAVAIKASMPPGNPLSIEEKRNLSEWIIQGMIER